MSSRKQAQHLARTLFDADHELFRDNVRRFFETRVRAAPRALGGGGLRAREFWLKAGDNGLLCATCPSSTAAAAATACTARS